MINPNKCKKHINCYYICPKCKSHNIDSGCPYETNPRLRGYDCNDCGNEGDYED